MTPKEKMIEAAYAALSAGLSKLIKNGMAFTVMGFAIAGLVFALFEMDRRHTAQIAELKADFKEMKADYSRELNLLRVEIIECNNERMKLSIRVAELSVRAMKVKR